MGFFFTNSDDFQQSGGGHDAKVTGLTLSGKNVNVTMYSSTNYQEWYVTGKLRVWY